MWTEIGRAGEIALSRLVDCQSRPIGRDGSAPSSATVHLFRQTVEVDFESVKSLFMAPAAGWLNRTHCHGVQREEGALQLQCLACIPTEVFQTNLPVMQISASAGVASMQASQSPRFANPVNTNLCCALLEAHVFTAPALAVD